MKISFLTGALAGAVVVTAGSALAGYHMYEAAHSAKDLNAKTLTRTVKIPRQDCHDEVVTHTKPVQDQNRLIGTGVGAVVGGLLGHEVGGGSPVVRGNLIKKPTRCQSPLGDCLEI